jgi:hypothetical protein
MTKTIPGREERTNTKCHTERICRSVTGVRRGQETCAPLRIFIDRESKDVRCEKSGNRQDSPVISKWLEILHNLLIEECDMNAKRKHSNEGAVNHRPVSTTSQHHKESLMKRSPNHHSAEGQEHKTHKSKKNVSHNSHKKQLHSHRHDHTSSQQGSTKSKTVVLHTAPKRHNKSSHHKSAHHTAQSKKSH